MTPDTLHALGTHLLLKTSAVDVSYAKDDQGNTREYPNMTRAKFLAWLKVVPVAALGVGTGAALANEVHKVLDKQPGTRPWLLKYGPLALAGTSAAAGYMGARQQEIIRKLRERGGIDAASPATQ